MRPPQNAGESNASLVPIQALLARFNEAPAERGGKCRRAWRDRSLPVRFNEAPAERGGKSGRQPPAVLVEAKLQ